MSAAATMMSAAAPARSHAPLIDIANLRVEFGPPAHPIIAVEGVDLTIEPGEIVGLVGESGSGKSVTALALMNLIDDPGRIRADRMTFAGEPTARLDGGMVPCTSELAPITLPSPIVVPGMMKTRQGSHTLLPSVTGSYVTG